MVLTGLNRNITIRELRDRIFLLLDSMDAAILRVVNENNSEFNAVTKEIRDNIITIIANNTIDDSLEELFDAYDLVAENARDRYLLNKEIFAFANDQTDILSNVDLTATLNVFDLGVQLMNLFFAYNNAADITFDNDEGLQIVIDALEEEFDRLSVDPLIDSDTRLALIEQKTATIKFFTNLDLRSITTVTTTTTPSTVLSYRYYGDSTQSDSIVALNKAHNTGFIEGDIRILSEN